MRTLESFATVIFGLAIVLSEPALAEKRVALVIGNSVYSHAPKLANPSNDAEAISILLKRSGFDVVETHENLDVSKMRRAIRDFSDQTRDADLAVLYYAGHGLEIGGNNYLIPTDAALQRDIDVEDEAVSLERVLTVLEPAKRLRLIILDACRDNPFTKSMKRTMASRTVGRGLARVEPTTSNTLIAFAAKAGSTAADGDSVNSPFTAALLQHIATPGLDLRIAFGRVRDDVFKRTGNRQEPFVYGSLGGGIVTLASTDKDESASSSSSDSNAVAARDYEAAAKVGTKQAWDVFLSVHPVGFYADLARSQLSKFDSVQKNRPAKRPSESQLRPAKKSQPIKQASKAGCQPKPGDCRWARTTPGYASDPSGAAWIKRCCS